MTYDVGGHLVLFQPYNAVENDFNWARFMMFIFINFTWKIDNISVELKAWSKWKYLLSVRIGVTAFRHAIQRASMHGSRGTTAHNLNVQISLQAGVNRHLIDSDATRKCPTSNKKD